MKLREQALLKVEPPTRPAIQRFPWKTNIVTTVFWVGEPAGANNPVSNYRSSWDPNWTGNYGGLDNPDSSTRRNCIPVAFIPRQNPFYCALPYNDVVDGQFKPEAPLVIPWFKQAYTGPGHRCARIVGSLFEKKIALATRNGKIAAHFARMISNTCSKMNGPSQI
jgi:hypothetical protein